MELGFQPETEIEYYSAIEELGGMRWSIGHALSHPGRYGYTKEQGFEGSSEVVDIYKLQTKLVNELKEKFGVVPPNEEAKEGQKAYWDWYNEMKHKYNVMLYKKDICYLCPFKKDEEAFIHNPMGMNCTKMDGIGNKDQDKCWIMFCNEVKYEDLLEMIKVESDGSSVDKFNKRYKIYQFINELERISKEINDIKGWANHIYNGSYGTTPEQRISHLENNVMIITTMIEPKKVLFEGNTTLIGIIDSIIEKANTITKAIESEKQIFGNEIEGSHKEAMINNSSSIEELSVKLQKAIWDSI